MPLTRLRASAGNAWNGAREYMMRMKYYTFGYSNAYAQSRQKYNPHTVFGSFTIKEGETVAIWSRNGNLRIVAGPSRESAGYVNTVQYLQEWKADPSEYLEVVNKNGDKNVYSGPHSLYMHPLVHTSISVRSKEMIGTHEAMIVFKPTNNGETGREILYGPMLYTPSSPHEWTQSFKWHFPRQVIENKGLAQSGVLRFNKLRLLPNHMYLDIEKVRTKDDALITVRTMVFFEIMDLERMLDATHDPINVMSNGIIADVIDWTSRTNLDTFKDNAHELNDIGTYKELMARSEFVGHKVTKVVFRGFESDSNLQKMHDNAIQKRTEIKLQKEAETAKQELEEYKLMSKLHRNEKEMELKQNQQQQEIELMRQHALESLEQEKELNDEKMRYYQFMREQLKCDITELIRAETENPNNTKIVRIDGNAQNANIHHHIDDEKDGNKKSIAK